MNRTAKQVELEIQAWSCFAEEAWKDVSTNNAHILEARVKWEKSLNRYDQITARLNDLFIELNGINDAELAGENLETIEPN